MTPFVPDYIQQATQHSRIVWYIKEYGSINRREAIRDLHIFELAARITELSKPKRGYTFRTESDPAPKGQTPLTRYYLTGGPGITKEDGQLNIGLGA